MSAARCAILGGAQSERSVCCVGKYAVVAAHDYDAAGDGAVADAGDELLEQVGPQAALVAKPAGTRHFLRYR